jgi:hypothetical protein
VSKATPATEAPKKKQRDLLPLLNRAQAGDETTVPELRECLQCPTLPDLLGGNLALQAQQGLIRKYSGRNVLAREAVIRKLELMREELSGPDPSPLERLLVERIVTCWLHLHYLEHVYANRESTTLELGTYYQRSLSSAQKRYLAAIRSLALIRKLAVPVLQVNIARRQVNIGQAAAVPVPGTDDKG